MKQLITDLYWIDTNLFPTLQNCQEYYNGCCFYIVYHFNVNVSYPYSLHCRREVETVNFERREREK